MTRLAVAEIDPTLVGLGRAVVAGLLAAALLAVRGDRSPARALWPRLALVSLGVVIGFPLFSSIALRSVPSAHGAVITGLLPVATAVMAVLRAGERPSWAFWGASALGLAAVLAFAAVQGAGRPHLADGLVLVAVAFGALGYAEGGALSRFLGGPRVICWALVLSLPVMVPVTAWRLAETGWPRAGTGPWAGFAYVSVVSMFLGFFAWYRGLALGGVARVGQVQLAQPVLTLLWSALLLGEAVTPATMLAAGVVLASVVLTQVGRAGAGGAQP
jgi:drug/metabolite transporter (DMT)-like permease